MASARKDVIQAKAIFPGGLTEIFLLGLFSLPSREVPEVVHVCIGVYVSAQLRNEFAIVNIAPTGFRIAGISYKQIPIAIKISHCHVDLGSVAAKHIQIADPLVAGEITERLLQGLLLLGNAEILEIAVRRKTVSTNGIESVMIRNCGRSLAINRVAVELIDRCRCRVRIAEHLENHSIRIHIASAIRHIECGRLTFAILIKCAGSELRRGRSVFCCCRHKRYFLAEVFVSTAILAIQYNIIRGVGLQGDAVFIFEIIGTGQCFCRLPRARDDINSAAVGHAGAGLRADAEAALCQFYCVGVVNVCGNDSRISHHRLYRNIRIIDAFCSSKGELLAIKHLSVAVLAIQYNIICGIGLQGDTVFLLEIVRAGQVCRFLPAFGDFIRLLCSALYRGAGFLAQIETTFGEFVAGMIFERGSYHCSICGNTGDFDIHIIGVTGCCCRCRIQAYQRQCDQKHRSESLPYRQKFVMHTFYSSLFALDFGYYDACGLGAMRCLSSAYISNIPQEQKGYTEIFIFLERFGIVWCDRIMIPIKRYWKKHRYLPTSLARDSIDSLAGQMKHRIGE